MTELTEDQPTASQIRANRAAWVQALRSGEYEQGGGVLRRLAADREPPPGSIERPTKDAYCCLGVGHNIVSGTWETGGMLSSRDQNPIVSVSGNLPYWTMEHLGLSNTDHENLVQMNDDFGFTFDQIADVIETADQNKPAGLTINSITDVANYLFAVNREKNASVRD